MKSKTVNDLGTSTEIENKGKNNTDDVQITLKIDTSIIETKTVNISGGSYEIIEFNWTATSGIHNITIIADSDNQFNESNETNNEITDEIEVSEALPDLKPTSIEYGDLLEDRTSNFTVTILNQGLVSANNTKISLIIGNATINSTTVNISANSQVNVTFNWTAIRGIHNLTIAADPDNEINESYEFNNNLTVQVFVVDAFVSDDAELTAPSFVELGEEFNISLFIKNTGTLDLENVSVSLNLSSGFNTTNSNEIYVGNLSVGEERVVNWTLKSMKLGHGEITVNITSQGNQINVLNNGIHCKYPCDFNHDGIIIHDYNDLMTAYKCFLGITKNCDNHYRNWTLMKEEYKCFANFN
ncbi:hypothetical protein BEH94_00580 [Candidatus Altiarchaeales archaeon WOR_SM1_SCG]|nr:hypothetical protein BEH94_00580 [Candidatus Altiarchaeales archaeon WOR_SM1_SCG]